MDNKNADDNRYNKIKKHLYSDYPWIQRRLAADRLGRRKNMSLLVALENVH